MTTLPPSPPPPFPTAAAVLRPLDYATPPALAVGASDALLDVRGVFVRFKRFVAVDRVDFALRPGGLLGLIGPNGAGKTTLLRAVAGIGPIDAGLVEVLGRRLDRSDPDSMRHVGFTPDTPPLYEQLTVRQFLRFIARGYDLAGPEVDERIDFWLDKVWLGEKADQKISALSRGMRQRVGIARTLLPNPHVILLDEPAGGLDPAGRVQFRTLLNELRRQGKAVVVSSHILADMDEYCSHIGIMSHGRLVRFGTVREISQAIGGGDSNRATYNVRLASPVSDLERRLAAIDGLAEVRRADDHAFTVAADAGDAAAGRLLADLIAAGLPVCGFAELRGDLEAAYLRTGVRQVD